MGQGYVLSANISRDSSCIVIADVQKNNDRVIIISPIAKIIMNELGVSFVGDTYFFANKKEV